MSLPPILRDRLRLPVVGSPLFIISNPDLVIGQCKAGVVGSFPSLNARPKELFEEWLIRITTELAEYDKAHPEAPSASRSCTRSSVMPTPRPKTAGAKPAGGSEALTSPASNHTKAWCTAQPRAMPSMLASRPTSANSRA